MARTRSLSLLLGVALLSATAAFPLPYGLTLGKISSRALMPEPSIAPFTPEPSAFVFATATPEPDFGSTGPSTSPETNPISSPELNPTPEPDQSIVPPPDSLPTASPIPTPIPSTSPSPEGFDR
eukprot:IDg15466t1